MMENGVVRTAEETLEDDYNRDGRDAGEWGCETNKLGVDSGGQA